jgi:hypothetical protein
MSRVTRLPLSQVYATQQGIFIYAVTLLPMSTTHRCSAKACPIPCLPNKDAVLLLTFGAVPIMARFFQILPPRSAAPASRVGGHYWRQMVPEFMQSADSSL